MSGREEIQSELISFVDVNEDQSDGVRKLRSLHRQMIRYGLV